MYTMVVMIYQCCVLIITVKNIDYRCIMYNISKSETINLLENPVLKDRGYILIFKTMFFFHFFLCDIYKMVDIMDVYNSLNISAVTVTKNSETLRFVPDDLKTKKMCKHAVKKISYLLRYVSDQYKTRQMCHEAILENDRTLKSVPNCYENQEMCNKAVENYPHELEFVPECYKTQNMCDKAVNAYPYTIELAP